MCCRARLARLATACALAGNIGAHLWADHFDGLLEDVLESISHATGRDRSSEAWRAVQMIERMRRNEPD
jgi:hypothetical protein